MIFGSCFSENIGNLMLDNKFDVELNPFGILYNPLSISTAIRRLLSKKTFSESELTRYDEMYHSFLHHGSFSAADRDECLRRINERYELAAKRIDQTDLFLITFGTAYVYRLKESGNIVGNCHKFPADFFTISRISIENVFDEWSKLIEEILKINQKSKFVFTVSPIRHWKDGAHENQLSKSILLLSIDRLMQKFPDSVRYFPAYELIMDDLRDYRFYASDMIHPSETAIEYIWERFRETFFSDETEKILSEWRPLLLALKHRPVNKDLNAYGSFLKKTLSKLLQFQEKYPFISLSNEIQQLQYSELS
jgi:hypothetical protein